MPEGVKYDTGKDQWNLLDWPWLTEVVQVLTAGAKKYAPDNWKVVPNGRARYIAALFRHVVAWIRGEQNDPEDGLHHLAHATCCIMFLFWFDKEAKNGKTREMEKPKAVANGVGSNLGLLARAKRRKT